jgi:hypothetical protein
LNVYCMKVKWPGKKLNIDFWGKVSCGTVALMVLGQFSDICGPKMKNLYLKMNRWHLTLPWINRKLQCFLIIICLQKSIFSFLPDHFMQYTFKVEKFTSDLVHQLSLKFILIISKEKPKTVAGKDSCVNYLISNLRLWMYCLKL